MNQILSTDDGRSKKQKNKMRSSGAPVEIKKIVLFFVCVITVFAFVLVGVQTYGIVTRMNARVYMEPMVYIDEIAGGVRIRLEHGERVQKLVYYWSEEYRTEEILGERSDFQKLVDIPARSEFADSRSSRYAREYNDI